MLKHQYSPDANSWLTGKHPDAGKDWRQKKWQRMRWLDGITDALDMNLGNFGRWWGTGKSDMLQFMGSWRVGHYLKTKQTARNLQCYSSLWRRQWQPTPVFLPGEFCGQRSLAGYSPWGHKVLYVTEWLTLSTSNSGIKQAWRHYSKISWWKNCTVGSPDSVCRTARGLGLICKPNQSTNQPTNQSCSPPTHQPVINQSRKIEGCFPKQIWTLRKSHGPSSALVPKVGHSLFYLS